MNSLLLRRPRRSRRILATTAAVALLTTFASTGNVATAAAGGALSMTPPSTADAPLLVTPGVGGEVSVTVTNTDPKGSTSALKVELSSSDPAFQVNGGCNAVALGAGKTCTFVVSYTAAAPTQDATASVAVSSKKPGIVAASTAFFQAVGVAPVAELSPASGLDFGDSPVGQTTAAQEVTLTNSGNAPLEITSQDLGGTNPGDFDRVATTCGTTLAAGAECQTSITFTPTDAGARSATFQVTDNATDSPQSVSLSGTTVNQADTTAPTVTRQIPASNATSVSVAANVSATFSENVTGVTDATMTLRVGTSATGRLVTAAVSYDATTRVATLDPNANLAADTRYTVTLTGGSPLGISDLAGNPLVTVAWSFLTGPAPVVTARTPASNATGVSVAANVTATFSEALNSGVTGVAMTLRVGTLATGTLVPAVVSYNATTRVATLNPSANLAANTVYTVRLTGAITDVAGNPLLTTVWSFTTGP